MDTHDRSTLLEHLESGLREVLQGLQDISEVGALHRPSPKHWSILDCIEHLVFTEDYLFARIQEATPSDKRVTNERREDAILSRGMDRTRVIESPDLAKPHGKFSTLAQAREAFVSARARSIHFVRAGNTDLRAQNAMHPLFGSVTCYEMMLMMAVHSRRHARQIAECKSSMAFSQPPQ